MDKQTDGGGWRGGRCRLFFVKFGTQSKSPGSWSQRAEEELSVGNLQFCSDYMQLAGFLHTFKLMGEHSSGRNSRHNHRHSGSQRLWRKSSGFGIPSALSIHLWTAPPRANLIPHSRFLLFRLGLGGRCMAGAHDFGGCEDPSTIHRDDIVMH